MATEEERGVVRVKVKKCEGMLPVEFRSFAVDPQITSLEVLQHILIRAFELNGKRNFGISYLSRDRGGVEVYLSLLSDWDLDAAFVSAAKPYLQLKVDIKPSEDSPVMEDWDIISPKDVIGSDQLPGDRRSLAATALPFTQSLLSQMMGRTLSRVQQALSWTYGEEVKPFKPPLSDAEFHSYLNGQGQLSRPEELRLRIYHGGVEPSLRKVVWRYLLNVYPDGLTGQERMDYMKRKTREYDHLKGEWLARVSPEDLEFIRGNVLKDVLRTDRAHSYYAGSEDSPHLTALTDLLTTFAITHPQVSYCQGMSDIASPILAVMDNEAHAFICFCGIMKRLEGNFRPDGQLMSVKFQHLKLLLQYSDPEFYSYLVSRGADDLFFCYRWLLLELKREFAFEDALRMLEVTWSSLPPDPPETEVELLGPPLEMDQTLVTSESGFEKRLPFTGNEEGERKEKQRRRHMLRPSREEADGLGNVNIEGVEGVRNIDMEGEGEDRREAEGNLDMHNIGKEKAHPNATVAAFEEQGSFGEFKYYSARNEDNFDFEERPPPEGPVGLEASLQLVSGLPVRQATEDSEEDPEERVPLITDEDKSSSPETEERSSPNGQTTSPASPFPPGSSPGSTPSPLSWRGDSPDTPPPKYISPILPNESPEKATRGISSFPSVPNGTGADSPATPTGRSLVSSPLLSRSLLSSPILSIGRALPSLPVGTVKSFSSNLPSPCSRASSTMPTPNSTKSENTTIKPCSLPPPQEFGKGNPFMLFLCLSILLEHRDHIIKNSFDYNELAMHFDRLVRRHNLSRVLQRAKALFADYLQSEVWDSEEGDEVSSDSPVTGTGALHSPPSATRPLFTPFSSPLPSSPNSTYNLVDTVPSPSSPASLSPS
ncbi:TBC1 domain family member 25 isoform X1 [Esox lucius]|uniref:TBC1 domain family member 25 isoform X1 n=2 Tax=Esox lucius TaxID=8010 RepID=UPI0014769877|nr:TBC1 domain family member 25 isoform X1 [Esox lucius]